MLLIFDLDGTLVDSARDLTNALNHAVAPYRERPFTLNEVTQLVGEGVTRLIEKALGEGQEGYRDEVRARFLQYYHAHITEYSRPYPGIPETLDGLRNCRKAVVSNKNENLSLRVLENLDILSHFDVVLGSDSVSESKPSPMPLFTARDRLGVKLEDCVMIGDSDLDMEAGKRAAMRTCAVTWGFRSRQLLEAFRPDDIVDEPGQLVALFGEKC